jgi:hypothetical protein
MLDIKDLPNFEAAATCSIAAAAAAANRWLLSNMVGPDPLEFGNSILPPPGLDTVQDFLYTFGHEITYASNGNHNFFNMSCYCQTYR